MLSLLHVSDVIAQERCEAVHHKFLKYCKNNAQKEEVFEAYIIINRFLILPDFIYYAHKIGDYDMINFILKTNMKRYERYERHKEHVKAWFQFAILYNDLRTLRLVLNTPNHNIPYDYIRQHMLDAIHTGCHSSNYKQQLTSILRLSIYFDNVEIYPDINIFSLFMQNCTLDMYVYLYHHCDNFQSLWSDILELPDFKLPYDLAEFSEYMSYQG